MLNSISVQHQVPNPDAQTSDVRAQPAHLEPYTNIREEDPDDGPDENSYAGLDDGSLADNIKEIEDDASLVQVSICCFI